MILVVCNACRSILSKLLSRRTAINRMWNYFTLITEFSGFKENLIQIVYQMLKRKLVSWEVINYIRSQALVPIKFKILTSMLWVFSFNK